MNFTNSHYEREMKKIPQHEEKEADPGVPAGSRCAECPYWRGIRCVSCYRELMRQLHAGR